MRAPTTGSIALVVLVVLVAAAACLGCAGRAQAEPGRSSVAPPPFQSTTPAIFSFESLDDRRVDDASTRGKPTVLAFVTTGSLPSQAQVDFLVAMAAHDGDRVNYALVALETAANRELVELYKKALKIPFPVSLADETTISGAGAFGDVTGVPVVVLLDRGGRIAWRMDGRVVKSDELRAAIRGL